MLLPCVHTHPRLTGQSPLCNTISQANVTSRFEFQIV